MDNMSATVGTSGSVGSSAHRKLYKLPRMSLDLLFSVEAPDTIRQERLASEARARERQAEEERVRAREAKRAEKERQQVEPETEARAEEWRREEDERQRLEEERARRMEGEGNAGIARQKDKAAVAEAKRNDTLQGIRKAGPSTAVETGRPKKRVKSVKFLEPVDAQEESSPPTPSFPPPDLDHHMELPAVVNNDTVTDTAPHASRFPAPDDGQALHEGLGMQTESADQSEAMQVDRPETGPHETPIAALKATEAAPRRGIMERLSDVDTSRPEQAPMRPTINTSSFARPAEAGDWTPMATPSSASVYPSGLLPPRHPLSSSFVPRKRLSDQDAPVLPTPSSAASSPYSDFQRPPPTGPRSASALLPENQLGLSTTRDRDAQSTTSSSSSNSARPHIFFSPRSGSAMFNFLFDVEDKEVWEKKIIDKAGTLCKRPLAIFVVFPAILHRKHWETFKTLSGDQKAIKTDWLEACLRRGKMVQVEDYRLNLAHFEADRAKYEAERLASRTMADELVDSLVALQTVALSNFPVPPATTSPPRRMTLEMQPRNSPARDPRTKGKALSASVKQSPPLDQRTTATGQPRSIEIRPSPSNQATERSGNPPLPLIRPPVDRTPLQSKPGDKFLYPGEIEQGKSASPINPPAYSAPLPIGGYQSPPALRDTDTAEAWLDADALDIAMEQDGVSNLFHELFGTDPPTSPPKTPAPSIIDPQTTTQTPSRPETPPVDDSFFDDVSQNGDQMDIEVVAADEEIPKAEIMNRIPTPSPKPPKACAATRPLPQATGQTIEFLSDSDDDFFEILDGAPPPAIRAKPTTVAGASTSMSKPAKAAPNASASASTRPPPPIPKAGRPPPTAPKSMRPAPSATQEPILPKLPDPSLRNADSPTPSTKETAASFAASSSSSSASQPTIRPPLPPSAPPFPSFAATTHPTTPPRPARPPVMPRPPQRPSHTPQTSPQQYGYMSSGPVRVAPRPPQILDMRQR